MVTLLMVENGWSSKRWYFADSEEGLVKSKLASKQQRALNREANKDSQLRLDKHCDVFLSRIQADKQEADISCSSSSSSEDEEEEEEEEMDDEQLKNPETSKGGQT